MKSFVVAFALIAAPAVCLSQEAPPKANTILVTLPDSGKTAWTHSAQALIQRGYIIKSSDGDLLTLSTEGRDMRRAGMVVIYVSINGRIATVRGTQYMPSLGLSNIDYRGMKGSPAMLGWQELEGAARALGGQIKFEKR